MTLVNEDTYVDFTDVTLSKDVLKERRTSSELKIRSLHGEDDEEVFPLWSGLIL